MRHLYAVSAMLISSAAVASAQGFQGLDPGGNMAMAQADRVVVRLMSFDRDRDGVITAAELSERMQGLVARGDRSGDGALDAFEIRSMVPSSPFTANARSSVSGGYGFGDSGLSSRTHIENSIDDLRLAPRTTQEAKRIAWAFADEFEGAALINLRTSAAPLLTEPQRAKFEADIAQVQGLQAAQRSDNGGPRSSVLIAALSSLVQATRGGAEQMQVATTAAVVKFRMEQQLDDARRFALVARMSGVLTDEESDNLRAALARRPLVKRPGGNFQVSLSPNAVIQPPSPVIQLREGPTPVRDGVFTTTPVVR